MPPYPSQAELTAEADRRRASVASAARTEEEIPLAAPAVRSAEVAVVEPLPPPPQVQSEQAQAACQPSGEERVFVFSQPDTGFLIDQLLKLVE